MSTKKISQAFLFVGLLIGLSSCCTKVECIGVEELYHVELYNFPTADLDSVTILSYAKNTNFNTLVDSTTTQLIEKVNHFEIFIDNRINPNLDYKFKIHNTAQIFRLTHFEIEKSPCNNCFPSNPESDYFDKLTAYSINGQRQSGSRIYINY